MRSSNKKSAYVWVQNRDNVWSKYPALPTAISPTVSLSNLLNEAYTVEIWNTFSGTVISSSQQVPSAGTISISLPSMTQDYAIKIISNSSVAPSPSPSISASVAPSPSASIFPSPSMKPGDIDGNGAVDIFDYNTLLTNFGKTGSGILGDIDSNGVVDIFDYNLILTNYGK
jgi:hypothetical protein